MSLAWIRSRSASSCWRAGRSFTDWWQGTVRGFALLTPDPSQPQAPCFDTVVKQARLTLPKCLLFGVSDETVMVRDFAVTLRDIQDLCRMD